MKKEKSYTHYLSFLKCLGMFAVIGIHTFCTPFSYWSDSYTSLGSFLSYFLTNALRAWAVPIFVMVSGSLFLDKSREISFYKLYGKYLLRLIFTLFTFGTLFALMERVFTAHAVSIKMLPLALIDVYAGNLWDHLWFVYMIMGLYIVTPPLKVFLAQAKNSDIKYLLVVLFSFNCIVPFLNSITGVKFGVYIPINTIWLFYYLLGYALHFEVFSIREVTSIIFILIGLLWCAFGQYLPNMTKVTGAALRYAGTSDIIAVLMATGIFAFSKAKCNHTANFLDTFINPLSFGVYILHALFINFILKVVHFTPEKHNYLIVWLLVFIITSIGSIISVWILRKIPFVKKYML